jgi:hypothetical protein
MRFQTLARLRRILEALITWWGSALNSIRAAARFCLHRSRYSLSGMRKNSTLLVTEGSHVQLMGLPHIKPRFHSGRIPCHSYGYWGTIIRREEITGRRLAVPFRRIRIVDSTTCAAPTPVEFKLRWAWGDVKRFLFGCPNLTRSTSLPLVPILDDPDKDGLKTFCFIASCRESQQIFSNQSELVWSAQTAELFDYLCSRGTPGFGEPPLILAGHAG